MKLAAAITLLLFTSAAHAASGPCGQDAGAQKVIPAKDQAVESLKKLCEGDSPAKKMKDLAQACKGPDGGSQVAENTAKYIQKLSELCQASARSVKHVAEVCAKNEAASKKAEDLDKKIAQMSGAKKNAEKMQAQVKKEADPIKSQLSDAASESGKNQKELDENDKGIDESDEDLRASNHETKKQLLLHQKKVADAKKARGNCARNCYAYDAEIKKAQEKRDAGTPACQELAAAQREVDKMQNELKEKLKGLKNELAQLEKEAQSKGEKIGALGDAHGQRLDDLTSAKSDVPKGSRTKEAWDRPPEKSGKKPPGKVGDEQETIATWYDPSKRDPKKYPKDAVTAASNYYPQGSVLEVTNTKTGQKTQVTVNDTGFFRTSDGGNAYSTRESDFGPSRGVGIDLSRQAARNVGLEKAGMGNVVIRRIK